MGIKSSIIALFLLLSLVGLFSCNRSDDTMMEKPPEISEEDPDMDNEDPDTGENPDTAGNVEFFNEALVSNGYILINDAAANEVYLMDKEATILHEWPLGDKRLGNDAFLMANGQLLIMLEAEDPKIEIGGFGGRLELLDKDGNTEWSFDYSSEDYILHHDAEMLPNGNIIVQIWERKTAEEANMAGSNLKVDVFPDGVIEINPATDEIVWEWYAWDHLIQDHDDTKENFGVVSEKPELINLNYVPNEKGDIMHANGIAYDTANDLIFLSVNFYSEVWVIDHSTTTAEASSHSGGNFDKGGDLVYRFGNPDAYDNSVGERLFYNNHFPNLLTGVDEGNIMIFSNGADLERSTVYELQLPSDLTLAADMDNEPAVVWSFTHPDLYSPRVSGAVKLPNGNRLITEGDFGVWEVTDGGEVIWRFSAEGFFWRAYHYEEDDPEILSLGL